MCDYIDSKIVIKSAWGKVGQRYTIQPCRDKSGVFADCVRAVDSKGDMILSDDDKNSNKIFIPENSEITFESGKEFDLTKPLDAAQWAAIKNCPLIADSMYQKNQNGEYVLGCKPGTRYSAAELYVERPGLETNKKISRREQIHNAETFIFNDPEGADGRLKHARLLGKNLKNAPDADVKEFLLDRASKHPEDIIKLYTGEDLPLRILFMEAKDKEVIYSKNRVYLYGDGIPLGQTIDAVIAWMRDPRNKKLLQVIKRDTYGEELEVTNENAKAAF